MELLLLIVICVFLYISGVIFYFIIKLAMKNAIKESLKETENSMKDLVKSSILEYEWAKNNK